MGRANIHSLLDKYDNDKTGKLPGHAKPFFEQALPVLLETNGDGSKNSLIISAYNYLANYYVSIGDNTSVGEYMLKIIAIDPNNEQARKTLDILKIKY